MMPLCWPLALSFNIMQERQSFAKVLRLQKLCYMITFLSTRTGGL
ncbi:hypothetical protein bas23_0072 [Escherichia phage WildeMaa]|nr:hypothetical protein bas23_0072 [Escherichia phage WildeMaa]